MSERCAGPFMRGFRLNRCPRKGTLEHDGHLWCKQHHPPTRVAKNESDYREYSAKIHQKIEQQNEMQRRYRAYDAVMEFFGNRVDSVSIGSIRRIMEGTK